MTRRLAIDYSLNRSVTIRARVELLLDALPLQDIDSTPTRSASPSEVPTLQPDVPTALDKTEDDR